MLTRPTSLTEALTLLETGGHRVVAGGTDVYPAMTRLHERQPMLDISAIAELRQIRTTPTHILIGASTTWSDLIEADLPPAFKGLKDAARQVGGRHIQNAGTIAGNICNASPAADGIPPLLTLDCEVEIDGPDGPRRLPLDAFIAGPGRHRLAVGELVTGLRIPQPHKDAKGAFEKLGSRHYLVISIAMVGVIVRLSPDKTIGEARVAVGACSPKTVRLPDLEAVLAGQHKDRIVIEDRHLSPLSPIDDARGTATYRRTVVRELIKRALEKAAKSDG